MIAIPFRIYGRDDSFSNQMSHSFLQRPFKTTLVYITSIDTHTQSRCATDGGNIAFPGFSNLRNNYVPIVRLNFGSNERPEYAYISLSTRRWTGMGVEMRNDFRYCSILFRRHCALAKPSTGKYPRNVSCFTNG